MMGCCAANGLDTPARHYPLPPPQARLADQVAAAHNARQQTAAMSAKAERLKREKEDGKQACDGHPPPPPHTHS